MASRETVTRVLVILSAAYPNFKASKETPSVYASLLADLDDRVLVAAAQHHAASSKWFPSVAELRDAAQEIMARASGIRTAEEAWINVERAIQRFGWYGEPIPPDQGGGWRVPSMLSSLEKSAIDGLGGWKMLCQSDNAPADRAHFLRIYAGLLSRDQGAAMMLPAVQDAIAQLAGRTRTVAALEAKR